MIRHMKTKLTTTLAAATLISLSSAGWVSAQAAASGSTPAASQEYKHHGRRHFDPDAVLARMTKKFGLTKEQQDKILPILQSEAATIKSSRAQIKAVLTPDQLKMLHGGQTGKG